VEPWRGTDERPEYPDLARILATARRWWWALLLGALAGAALALAAGGNSAVSYQASTRLLVGPIGGEYSLLRAAGQQAQTYADLATSQPVVLATRARLGAAASPDGLRRHVSAQADDVSRLLTITAQASRPEAAARIANTLAEELQRVTRATVPQSANELRVVEPAQAPQRPVQGHARMLVVLAALAGLLAVLTVLVMSDLARGRVATESELAAASPAPVLGTAGRDPTTLTRAMGLLGDGRRRIVIAGVDDDGAGTRAARALVAAIAASGSHAVLVDADPRTSAGGPRPGDEGPPEAEAGGSSAPAYVVVISAPAATGLSLAKAWARGAGGIVLAVRSGHTTRDRVAGAVELLERSGATVLGTVLVRRALRLPKLSLRSHARQTPPAGTAGEVRPA
jgi:capsular polysaccharide biosynthesis protein